MTDILIGLGVLAGAVAFLLACPVITCPRCLGRRVRHNGRRPRPCRTCKATGLIVPWGATAVHGFFWSVFGDRLRDQRRAAVTTQVSERKAS